MMYTQRFSKIFLVFTLVAVIFSGALPVNPSLEIQKAQAVAYILGGDSTFSCDVSQTVELGTTASISLSYDPILGAQDQSYTVSMTSDVSGPSLVDDPMILPFDFYAPQVAIASVDTSKAIAGTYYLTFTLAGSGGKSDPTCVTELIVAVTPDTIDIQFDDSQGPVNLLNGTSGSISWYSANYTNCTADSSPATSWSGAVTPSEQVPHPFSFVKFYASQTSDILSGPETYTFTISCDMGPDIGQMTVTDSVEVVVAGQYGTDIKCSTIDNPAYVDNGCTINAGNPVSIQWSSQNMDACHISSDIGAPDFEYDTLSNPGINTALLQETHTYTIQCATTVPEQSPAISESKDCSYAFNILVSNGEKIVCITDFVTVTVNPVTSTITADLKCSGTSDVAFQDGPCVVQYGEAATISWSSEGANICSVSSNTPAQSPDFSSGELSQPSGISTGNLTTTHIYTISCQLGSFMMGSANAEKTNTKLSSNGPRVLGVNTSNPLLAIPNPAPTDGVDGDGGGVSLDLIASDTVTVTVVDDGGDFTLQCSPLTAQISPGDSISYEVTTTGVGSFVEYIDISSSVSSPSGGDARFYPTVNLPTPFVGVGVPGQTLITDAVVSTVPSTGQVSYVITFTATATTKTKTCDVILTVESTIAPSSPVKVTVDNSTCDQMTIAWEPGSDSNDPSYYRVYHKGAPSDSWTQIDTEVHTGATSYSVVHSTPIDGSNYYAVSGMNGPSTLESNITEPSITPVALKSCAGDLTLSDQDVLSVAGKVSKNFNPVGCSAVSEIATLPNNALFSPLDLVTFKVNVCNSGPSGLTGVTLRNTLANLSNVTSVASIEADCITSYTYDPDANVLEVSLKDIEAAGGKGVVPCDITFSATIDDSVGGGSSLYRFQSIGHVFANEISKDVDRYPLGYYEIYTPPYLFNIGGSIPTRSETSPQ